MILLYQDPQGKTSVMGHSRTDSNAVGGFSAPHVHGDKNTDLDKKVALLEKTVLEREKTIAELKHKIDALTKVSYVVVSMHYYTDYVYIEWKSCC